MKTIQISDMLRSNGVFTRRRIEQIKLLATLPDGEAATFEDITSPNSGPYYGLTSAARRLGFRIRSGFHEGSLFLYLVKAADYSALATDRKRSGIEP